ncbi:MAG: hypothetical protein ACSHXD_15805 [Marinosulfonomonas sp.]
MSFGVQDRMDQRPKGALGATIWLGLALVACLYVAILNGGPLYYYDSGAYLENGYKVLKQVGLVAPVQAVDTVAAGGAVAQDATPNSVNGSRSVVYSLFASVIGFGIGLKSLPLFHALLVFWGVYLPIRVACRLYDPDQRVAALFAAPIIAAGFGALPFYVAFLMPDILTGLLLLLIATITVFGRDMTWAELLAALILSGLAVTSHLSHLAIVALMLPLSVIAAILLHRSRWWLPALCVAAILGIGLAERVSFSVAVEAVEDAEVVYYPFLTARIVEDGPGYTYLENHCPDQTIPTCALYDALSMSTDPWRLTASHIIFEKSARLGSFRLMPEAEQQAVANGQVRFFLSVFLDQPISTIGALLGNTFEQAGMNSVEMTIPVDGGVPNLSAISSIPPEFFPKGSISRDASWLPLVETLHRTVYVVSLIVIVGMVFWPGSVPIELKAFAGLVGLGILVNAFVCGGISQPATRYGGRVIWLLPFLATLLLMFSTWANPGMNMTRNNSLKSDL